MRVFDKYSFNIIDKVKFKDTKQYLDDMLANMGLRYNNISFTFRSFITSIDKVTEKYPELDKYRYGYQYNGKEVLTSLTPNWADGEIYADMKDWDSIFSVVSKIPRGYNIIPRLVFEQIDWYEEGIKEASLKINEITENEAMLFMNIFSINSQIIMERQYDYGNKYNIVHVIVEATTIDEPRDTTDIIKKVEPYLGQPYNSARICRFNNEENRLYEKRVQECRQRLDTILENAFPRRGNTFSEEIPFIPNLADKKKIKAAFKGTDFVLGSRKGLLPGMNRVVCINKYNHFFEILFDRTQSSPNYFYFYISVKGHNFYINSKQMVVYAFSEDESVIMLSKIADLCVKVKDEFGELLEQNFGSTPNWYTHVS